MGNRRHLNRPQKATFNSPDDNINAAAGAAGDLACPTGLSLLIGLHAESAESAIAASSAVEDSSGLPNSSKTADKTVRPGAVLCGLASVAWVGVAMGHPTAAAAGLHRDSCGAAQQPVGLLRRNEALKPTSKEGRQ
jgi:hypothetical protein